MNPFEADFIGVRNAGPFRSFSETMMSGPFCAALGWVHGTATFAALHRFDDPAVNAHASRVRMIADPQRRRYHPRLEARLADGRSLAWEETRGEEAYRLDWASAGAMAAELGAEAGTPTVETARLIAAVDALPAAGAVAPLIDHACAIAARAHQALAG